MFMDSDVKAFLLIGGLLLAIMAIVVYEVALKPLPVYAEEAELIYDAYTGPYLEWVVPIIDGIEEMVPEVGTEHRDLLVARWTSFEAHIAGQPISSVDPLYLDTTFSILESANLDYQTLIKAALLESPIREDQDIYVLARLDYLDELLSRLNLVRDSVVRYHEAIQ